ncbi:hypothetical protein Cpap_1477 [Ruminiclostridium papyrosolvens DSM 2782]|uniref:Uncharacterized protein n=1 Tax=Ruminiclostridium papyrosolvens DSM 2782 TaxID=588581 RepID=F1TEB9_9FIRM|nr:hypothetical protein [Ruminiclostridium papyrosolvens]EGD47085.1 hypothetical protein Cpap_1477 [Ruminiclostridium papyrosolvens DSM 2782]WES36027.1 hypothetical protein P0092_08715 [Ruminiclostridium papyrosolvens DSM 2782]WES36125.1 hypothetical protein P0092_09215 [Ruminiclostridium papyrosolvens DSM 2782]
MPIEYKVYGCKFKCGYRHKSNIKDIEEHEKICWYNPDNKTCITCAHGSIVHDYCDHPELPGGDTEHWLYRECKINSELEFENNIYKQPIKPKVNCKNWEPKEE